MTSIGIISDTHSWLDPQIFEYFKNVDIILHAGDVGNVKVIDELKKFKPIVGVYGNIDDYEVRQEFPLHQKFSVEGMKFWMTHIGGYPGRYVPKVREKLNEASPDIFICGHSHILKVMRDKRYNMLTINPGAAGKHGFHKIRTIIRFKIESKKIFDMEAVELGMRGDL